MAAELSWLDDTRDDVREILKYIATENPNAATKYVAELAESCERLADHPLSGRRYNAAFRTIVFRNHLIFFRFDEQADEVIIVAVLDGRRDIERLIGERD
ncbi:MAG: type II toxin-antitoxin system RelE/ParE family toxin [Rhizobiaceae bacterium]